MDKKEINICLIIIPIIVVTISFIVFNSKNNNNVNNNSNNNEINYQLVKDYNRFFTINSCVYKYINYLSTNSTNKILNVLDNEYKKQNNINDNNLYNFVQKLNGNYSFTAKKIYLENNNNNIKKYYVYGYLTEETINGPGNKFDYYIIVNLDLENNLFSIIPDDGTLFKEGIL